MIVFEVKALSNEIMRYMDNAARGREVTGMQRGIMHFLSMREEDTYQRDVEEEFHIRRSTASGILALMEKNGLILRLDVPHDARLKKLVLTDKARALHQEASIEIEVMENTMARGISESDLEAFFRVAERIKKNIGA